MARLARKCLAHWFSFDKTTWQLIGKDIEDMSMELNPDVESFQNILGETGVIHNGYDTSMSAEPYYADPDDVLYDPLLAIALNRDYSEEKSKGYLLEGILDPNETTNPAWLEEAWIVPQSYGGDTSGFQIPYEIRPAGNRKAGTVVVTNQVPTFTAT